MKGDRNDLEVSLGPHQARRDWRVLRVNYNADDPRQQTRVSEALKTLFSPLTAEVKQQKAENS